MNSRPGLKINYLSMFAFRIHVGEGDGHHIIHCSIIHNAKGSGDSLLRSRLRVTPGPAQVVPPGSVHGGSLDRIRGYPQTGQGGTPMTEQG